MKLSFELSDTIEKLLHQEDTDRDNKITIEDTGPKLFNAVSVDDNNVEIKGTYFLSNFLQELVLAKESVDKIAEINFEQVFEKPANRLSRIIKDYFWDGLTRRIDAEGIQKALVDTKAESKDYYLYVPHNDDTAYEYYSSIVKSITEINITVVRLPEEITPGYVRGINNKPGVLSLDLTKNEDGKIEGVPFVVPGGRFNEMYGWDSYFESLGLLVDGRTDLAKAMADNFVYEIEHYGQILNANRTYYLTRSQPPFLTSLAKAVFSNLPKCEQAKQWLDKMLNACIREYKTVWMRGNKLTDSGLNRFYGTGIGLAPETELTHFDTLLKPYADKAGMPVREYHRKYLNREIVEPDIEEFIMHDRSIRESGHDTSYRLDGISANLNTVDLNSLLYKYETDIADLIRNQFDDSFKSYDGTVENSADWIKKSEARKSLINKLMWNEENGFFFDHNFMKDEQTGFESATSFYTMWVKLATKEQADLLVRKALPLLEFPGGVAGSSKESVGEINKNRPQKQWDYPNGWAPHQMLIWEGLLNYGYNDVAERLIYKWLYLILKNAVDYNGTIPEKYDVVECTHKVFAEYGNVGTEFDYISREGFGWMNASFKVGLSMLSEHLVGKLNELIPPGDIF